MNKFTQEDLVQYLYCETSDERTEAITSALESDWDLRDSFEQLSSGYKKLEEIHLSPRNEAVNRILEHISKEHGQLYPH